MIAAIPPEPGALSQPCSSSTRTWSIIPVVYVGIAAAWSGFTNPRSVLVLGLVALWGARLTFNFWRKGGYSPGGEDYRWPILRERLGWRDRYWMRARQ